MYSQGCTDRDCLQTGKPCIVVNHTDSLPQVSVLTDQVEVQGEKIRDLEMCLEEHREKLNATEDMLQQVGSGPVERVARESG